MRQEAFNVIFLHTKNPLIRYIISSLPIRIRTQKKKTVVLCPPIKETPLSRYANSPEKHHPMVFRFIHPSFHNHVKHNDRGSAMPKSFRLDLQKQCISKVPLNQAPTPTVLAHLIFLTRPLLPASRAQAVAPSPVPVMPASNRPAALPVV